VSEEGERKEKKHTALRRRRPGPSSLALSPRRAGGVFDTERAVEGRARQRESAKKRKKERETEVEKSEDDGPKKEAPNSFLSLSAFNLRREPDAPHAAPFPQFQSSAPSAGLPLAQAQRARQSTEGQGCDWRVSVFIRSFFFLAAFLSFHFVFFTSRASKSCRVPVRLASPFPRAMQPTVQDNSSHIDRAHRGGSEGGQSCRLRGGASHEMMRGRFSLGRAQVLFLKNDIFLASAGAFFERESHLFPQPEAAVRHALCVPGVRTGRAKTRTLRKKGKTFGGGEKHESIFSPLLRSRTCSHLL